MLRLRAACFFMGIKMLLVKGISWELSEEISIKKYLPIQSSISSFSENIRGGLILTLSFPDDINNHEELLF